MGSMTDDKELEREFTRRAHFECAAGLLDELTNGDRGTLTEMAINHLGRRVESGALDEKECTIVERMIERITAEGRLDLTYGAYSSSPGSSKAALKAELEKVKALAVDLADKLEIAFERRDLIPGDCADAIAKARALKSGGELSDG